MLSIYIDGSFINNNVDTLTARETGLVLIDVSYNDTFIFQKATEKDQRHKDKSLGLMIPSFYDTQNFLSLKHYSILVP